MTLLGYEPKIARRPCCCFVLGVAQMGMGMVVVAMWLPEGSFSPVDQAAARNLEEVSEGRAGMRVTLLRSPCCRLVSGVA
jgi:hypothetical protein